MTVLRRELRELLTWCLTRRAKFRSPDAQAALNKPQTSTNYGLKRLENMHLLQREAVNRTTHYFTVINRATAQRLASTASPTERQNAKRDRRQVFKKTTIGRVNSIWQLGQMQQRSGE
jgi:hypothetical protein